MCWICDIFADEDLVEQYTPEELCELEEEREEAHRFIQDQHLEDTLNKEY